MCLSFILYFTTKECDISTGSGGVSVFERGRKSVSTCLISMVFFGEWGLCGWSKGLKRAKIEACATIFLGYKGLVVVVKRACDLIIRLKLVIFDQ